MRLRPVLLTIVLPYVLSTPAAEAQDFLFGHPVAQVTVRGGPIVHRAHSDVFDFLTEELTIERGDFRAPSIGGEFTLIVHPRVDVALGLAWSEVDSDSEFRHWVEEVEGEPDRAIEQWTRLQMTPVSVTVRGYPLARGEQISRLAWIPSRATPYVGAGGGITWYRLQQEGDFVDFEDGSIFTDRFESTGHGWTGHVLAGVDFWVTAKLGINADARYTVGSAPLVADFGEWTRLDVSGLQAGLGLTLRW